MFTLNFQKENEAKDVAIDHLRKELDSLQEELQEAKYDREKSFHHRNEFTSSVDVLNESPGQASSSTLSRPYSSYVDLNSMDGSTSLHHSEDSAPETCSSKSEANLIPKADQKQKKDLDNSKKKSSSMKWSQKYVLTKHDHSPSHNSKT